MGNKQFLAGEFCVVEGEFFDLRCLMNTLDMAGCQIFLSQRRKIFILRGPSHIQRRPKNSEGMSHTDIVDKMRDYRESIIIHIEFSFVSLVRVYFTLYIFQKSGSQGCNSSGMRNYWSAGMKWWQIKELAGITILLLTLDRKKIIAVIDATFAGLYGIRTL